MTLEYFSLMNSIKLIKLIALRVADIIIILKGQLYATILLITVLVNNYNSNLEKKNIIFRKKTCTS